MSTIGFFGVGVFTIVDVFQAMKEEYEQVKKEKEEVVLFSKKISLEEIMRTAEDTKKS